MKTLTATTRGGESSAAQTRGAKSRAENAPLDSPQPEAPFFELTVQRKAACACGGACPKCRAANDLPVSQPTDAAEMEADEIAEKVLRFADNPAPVNPSKIAPVALPAQAKKNTKSFAGSELSERIALTQKIGGNPLDGATRSFMENRFGMDFGGVKIHTGAESADLNRALDARAFTVGGDIYFNEGEFQPRTEGGRRLLAHELTHVAQQRKTGEAAPPKIQRQPAAAPAPVQQTPAPPQKTPPQNELDEALSFMFRTETDIPPAERGETNSPFMIWCIKSAFNIGEEVAARMVMFVGWTPKSDTRNYKKGEFIKYTLKISGIVETYKYLAGEGIVDEQAVQKFEEIIALRAQMTARDRTFFDKTGTHQFSNLAVDAFTVSNLGVIEKRVQDFMLDKESVLAPLGLLDDYYRTEDVTRDLDFEALKDRLYGKKSSELTEAEKDQILSLFRNKAMRKVFLMLDKSNTIAGQELKRYTSKPEELSSLISLLIGTYGPSYSDADRLRVQAIYRFLDTYKPDYYSVPGGEMTFNFRQIIKFAAKGENDLLERISQIPAENIEFQLSNYFVHRMMRSNMGVTIEDAQKTAAARVRSEFPEFESAKIKDIGTHETLKKDSTKQYPILYDLSLDFRSLSRLPRSELETKILDELRNKASKSAETQRYLLEKPWRIWEFEPLLRAMMLEEGLSKDDIVGEVIHDKIESIKDHKFWRSIGLAALGLAMGIAGFFTGGATWVGFALIAGSVAVNLIDLHYELEDYALHSAAAEATFEGGLTNAPSSIGVIFAVGGLVLDFVDVLKFLKPIAKPLANADDVARYAVEAFTNLKAAGKLKEGVTQEMFVKQLVENWTKREKMISSLLPDVKALVDADAFKSLHQGVQEGLFRVFDKDPDAFTHLVKTFGDQPDILTRLGSQAMLNPHAAENIAELHKFVKGAAPDQLADVMRYYGSVGERALHNLDDVLNVLKRGTISSANPELTRLILTNRNLQQSLLTHAADPDTLLRYWEQYQTTLSKLPPDSPVPDFVKYLDEQQAGTKLAETSGGVAQKVEFSVADIKITAQLTEKDLATVNKIIQRLVKEKGFISPEQMQAIIRTAEAADLTGTISKNVRGVLYQLNSAYSRIASVGMKNESLFALLRGLENADEFSTALKLVDRINSGAPGLKTVDDILSSMKLTELDTLIKFQGEAVDLTDVLQVAKNVKVASNASGEVFQLALKAGEAGGKFSDVRRLRYIVESLGEGPHTVDAVEKAIAAADVFDRQVAEALAQSEGGLEAMTKVVWGEKALGKSGKAAYNTVFGNPEKAQKIIKGILTGTEIDPVKWAVLRKTIDGANIPQSIKNNIIGELWARAGIESYTAKGYQLVDREIQIMFRSGAQTVTAKADAVMRLGDEIFIMEFKSGDAVFSEGQELIYPLVKKADWQNLRIADPALEKAVKAAPEKVKFIEVREPYNF